MSGKPVDLFHFGFDRIHPAVNTDLPATFEDFSSKSAIRLVADKQNGIPLMADVLPKMMLDAAGITHTGRGHDDAWSANTVD